MAPGPLNRFSRIVVWKVWWRPDVASWRISMCSPCVGDRARPLGQGKAVLESNTFLAMERSRSRSESPVAEGGLSRREFKAFLRTQEGPHSTSDEEAAGWFRHCFSGPRLGLVWRDSPCRGARRLPFVENTASLGSKPDQLDIAQQEFERLCGTPEHQAAVATLERHLTELPAPRVQKRRRKSSSLQAVVNARSNWPLAFNSVPLPTLGPASVEPQVGRHAANDVAPELEDGRLGVAEPPAPLTDPAPAPLDAPVPARRARKLQLAMSLLSKESTTWLLMSEKRGPSDVNEHSWMKQELQTLYARANYWKTRSKDKFAALRHVIAASKLMAHEWKESNKRSLKKGHRHVSHLTRELFDKAWDQAAAALKDLHESFGQLHDVHMDAVCDGCPIASLRHHAHLVV